LKKASVDREVSCDVTNSGWLADLGEVEGFWLIDETLGLWVDSADLDAVESLAGEGGFC
jgi:hypothetical protein